MLGENLSPGTMEVAAGLMQGEAAMERDVFERALEREELIDELQSEVRSLKESLAIAHVELKRAETGRRASSAGMGGGASNALSIADGHLSKAGREMEQLRNDLASTRNAIRQSKSLAMGATAAGNAATAAMRAFDDEDDHDDVPSVSPVRFALGGATGSTGATSSSGGSSSASPRVNSESRGKSLIAKLEAVQRNLEQEKDKNRALSERLLASHRRLEQASIELEKQEDIERDLREVGFRLLQATNVGGSGGASSRDSNADFSSPPAPQTRSSWSVRPGRWEAGQMQYVTRSSDGDTYSDNV